MFDLSRIWSKFSNKGVNATDNVLVCRWVVDRWHGPLWAGYRGLLCWGLIQILLGVRHDCGTALNETTTIMGYSSDQPSVPAISTVVFADFKFFVDGYQLSPEPACRFSNGFPTKFYVFDFQGRMSCIRTICFILQGHRKISFAQFLTSGHLTAPVRFNWSVFAREIIHFTSIIR